MNDPQVLIHPDIFQEEEKPLNLNKLFNKIFEFFSCQKAEKLLKRFSTKNLHNKFTHAHGKWFSFSKIENGIVMYLTSFNKSVDIIAELMNVSIAWGGTITIIYLIILHNNAHERFTFIRVKHYRERAVSFHEDERKLMLGDSNKLY